MEAIAMKRFAAAAVCCAVAAGLLGHSRAAAREPTKYERPTVQLAILLDTSNSMDGLIAQAKTQLWTVVNEFVRAKKGGLAPAIQVALFEYGKQSLPANEGYVRLILPLTDDLDRISEELFALGTNGGDEFCGWVIRDAVNRLRWNPSRDVYKAIFIAGNEPFSQGPVEFHSGEHDLLRPERGGEPDRLEGRGDPRGRPVHEHRPGSEGGRHPRAPGRGDRPARDRAQPHVPRVR
jgi:hypothetical protein